LPCGMAPWLASADCASNAPKPVTGIHIRRGLREPWSWPATVLPLLYASSRLAVRLSMTRSQGPNAGGCYAAIRPSALLVEMPGLHRATATGSGDQERARPPGGAAPNELKTRGQSLGASPLLLRATLKATTGTANCQDEVLKLSSAGGIAPPDLPVRGGPRRARQGASACHRHRRPGGCFQLQLCHCRWRHRRPDSRGPSY
jgi:hypothetical protein